jgi:hypothetical protein
VDEIGDAADAAGNPDLLRLENLDTDVPPPAAGGTQRPAVPAPGVRQRARRAAQRPAGALRRGVRLAAHPFARRPVNRRPAPRSIVRGFVLYVMNRVNVLDIADRLSR